MRTTCTEHPGCVLLDATDVGSRRSERIHATLKDGDLYQIAYPPIVVHSCALGDIVRASQVEDHLVVEAVVRASPLLVMRLEEQQLGILDEVLPGIAAMGAVTVRQDRLVNVTMPPKEASRVLERLVPYVQTGQVTWVR